MCAIAGLCGWQENRQENIRKMNERMSHRGPDASGIWEEDDGSVIFGHQRLAIVDLSENGAQPMHSHSGRFVVTFNGEIYNYKEIAALLIKEEGVASFRGTSDTEVLLEAVEQLGIKKAVSLCKGMFSAAFWDRKERVLYLVRDRVGEKPLYYGFVGKSFVFASDIASIAVLDGFEERMNKGGLRFYFTHGYIPAPHSIYEGIHKLEAGCILTVREPFDKPRKESYWSMEEAAVRGMEKPFQGSREEAADELERLLKASIRGQMCADVPVGAFLSAGIDSSTIVALMQDLNQGKVRSFTIGMQEKEFNEADAAEKIAAHLGTAHTRLTITEKDAIQVIPALAHMFGEPFGDSSQIPTFLVSKMTREHVTVALSGDGGDELFAGYNIYGWCDRIWTKMKNYPPALRRAAGSLIGMLPLVQEKGIGLKGKLLKADNILDVYRINYERDPLALRIPLENSCPEDFYPVIRTDGGLPPIKQVMLQDMLLYHPDDILAKVDRTSMAVSLETRVPMLDKDVVEFAWSLPIEYNRRGDLGKLILRDVLYRYVPREMMDRPKKGFSIPIRKWLKEPKLKEWAQGLLAPEKIKAQGILNPDVVKQIWEDFTQRDIWRVQIWYLLMFQEWMEK